MNFDVITDPVFYLCAIPAVLIVGVSKSGFGGGLGLMGVPLLTLAISPQDAAAVMLPVLCMIDVFILKSYWRKWDARALKILLPAALVGIGLGTAGFHLLTDTLIKGLVAAVTIAFTLHHWLQPKTSSRRPKPGAVSGGFWGSVAGFTSFIAHAGGPPLSMYMLPQRMDKTLFVGTTVIFFIVVNYVKLLPYAWLGQFHGANPGTALVLMPVAALGAWLGIWAHHRVNQDWFYRICYVLLFLTGLKLAQEVVFELFV